MRAHLITSYRRIDLAKILLNIKGLTETPEIIALRTGKSSAEISPCLRVMYLDRRVFALIYPGLQSPTARGRAVSPVEAAVPGTLDGTQAAEWPFLGRVIPRVKAVRYRKSPK